MDRHNIRYDKQRKRYVEKTKCNAYPYSGIRKILFTVIVKIQML